MLRGFKNPIHNAHKPLSSSLMKNLLKPWVFSFSSAASTGEEEVYLETREEKDLRYEDECFYFQREWTKLQTDKLQKKQDYTSPDLSEHQQRECDILVKRILQLGVLEKQYFEYTFNEKCQKTSGVEPGKPNIFSLKRIPKLDLTRDYDNPNWESSQKILSVLTPFIASGYFTGGAGPVTAGQADQAEVKQVKKEKEPEKVQIKARVDLKLSSFDAGKKIAIIKEVRSLLTLGLKEAKELVEKAPVIIKQNIPRAEAEELEKKLKDIGAVIELV